MGVMNSARVNETTTGSVSALQAEIATLRAQVEAYRIHKRASGSLLSGGSGSPSALDGRRRLSANRGMFMNTSPVLISDKKNIMSGLSVQHCTTTTSIDYATVKLQPCDGSLSSPPRSPLQSHRMKRLSSGNYSIETTDTIVRSSKGSVSPHDKENVTAGNRDTIRVVTPPGTKVQISKLIADNTLLLRINRELEDALEEREAAIDKGDKALAVAMEDLERCKYELEMALEASNGRFSHTKILLGTLHEIKAENEALTMEVTTLRCAKDSLKELVESETQIRLDTQHQLACLQEEHIKQSDIISGLHVEIAEANSRVHSLQRELSLMEHKYKDESNRADQLQMNLGAMKIMSKLSTSSSASANSQSTNTCGSNTTIFPHLDAGLSHRDSVIITSPVGRNSSYLSSSGASSNTSSHIMPTDMSQPSTLTPPANDDFKEANDGAESDEDDECDDGESTVKDDMSSRASDTDVQSMGTDDTFDTVVQNTPDGSVKTSATVVQESDRDDDNDETQCSSTLCQEKEDRWSATIVKGLKQITGYGTSPSRAPVTSYIHPPSRHVIVQATSTASSLTEVESDNRHGDMKEDDAAEEGPAQKKMKKPTLLRKV